VRSSAAPNWRLAFTVCLAVGWFDTGAALARDYWVAPAGNDADAGAQDKPFATLERARDALRAEKARTSAVTVWVGGGTYAIARTFPTGGYFHSFTTPRPSG
jgi:hypothetical protein